MIKTTIIVFLLIVIGGYFYTNEIASEKIKSAINVIKQKNEMALVDYAGKSQVILDMAEKRIDTLRKRLIALKSTKRTLKRKLQDKNLTVESKENLTKLMTTLDSCEKRGEDALLKSKTRLDELHVKLEMIDTEISITKPSSKLINEFNPKYTNDELKKLIAAFEKDLDDANAELDVAILEAK